MNPEFQCMSREARIRRIGQLLSKAVTLMLVSETETNEQMARRMLAKKYTENILSDSHIEVSDDAKAIMAFLKRIGTASPAEICQYTELSRTTVFRRLRELQQRGVIGKTGSTIAVRYRIVCGHNESASAEIVDTGETQECRTAVAK